MPDIEIQTLGVVAGVVLLIFLAAAYFVRSKKNHRTPQQAEQNLFPGIQSLPDHGPDGRSPLLACHGMPVRVVMLVLAPSGRHGEGLSKATAFSLADSIAPGLQSVLLKDQPEILLWPSQLSVRGFVQAFFSNLSLPGDRGKGTPWVSVAGRVDGVDGSYLVGLILCASKPNSLGTIEIEHSGKWPDVIATR